MIALKKYKQVTAAFLVALYLFIATPVQFWHHHNDATGTLGTVQNTSDKKGIVKPSANTDDNCSICLHEYTIYDNQLHSCNNLPLIVPTSKNGYYHPNAIVKYTFTLQNKGPPTVI